MPDRKVHSVIVSVVEGEAGLYWVSPDLFDRMAASWRDEEYSNLRAEWYEGGSPTPDLRRVFAYWQDDSEPSYADLRRWGASPPQD